MAKSSAQWALVAISSIMKILRHCRSARNLWYDLLIRSPLKSEIGRRHGSPYKLRPSFCGSSEKSPLAITLIAGASAGLASQHFKDHEGISDSDTRERALESIARIMEIEPDQVTMLMGNPMK